jgi:hypothetical protein
MVPSEQRLELDPKKVVETVAALGRRIDGPSPTSCRCSRPASTTIRRASPAGALTPEQHGRYLDYCSELLSLTGKVVAIYVRTSQDPVVLAAVNEVDDLTTGLSQKIWQKLMVLHRAH